MEIIAEQVSAYRLVLDGSCYYILLPEMQDTDASIIATVTNIHNACRVIFERKSPRFTGNGCHICFDENEVGNQEAFYNNYDAPDALWARIAACPAAIPAAVDFLEYCQRYVLHHYAVEKRMFSLLENDVMQFNQSAALAIAKVSDAGLKVLADYFTCWDLEHMDCHGEHLDFMLDRPADATGEYCFGRYLATFNNIHLETFSPETRKKVSGAGAFEDTATYRSMIEAMVLTYLPLCPSSVNSADDLHALIDDDEDAIGSHWLMYTIGELYEIDLYDDNDEVALKGADLALLRRYENDLLVGLLKAVEARGN